MKTTTASTRQTFALFCATGKDWRSQNLTHEQASNMLSAIMHLRGNKPAALDLATRVHNGEQVNVSDIPIPPSFSDIFEEAHNAGLAAAAASKPIPMVVTTMSGKPLEIVSGGVCGFAWVHFVDGRNPFPRWLTRKGLAGKSYRGGTNYHIGYEIGGQSLTIKEDYCSAFADVCQKHGIKCYAQSRMD